MATYAEERKAAAARKQSEIEKALAGALRNAAAQLERVRLEIPVDVDQVQKVLDQIQFVLEARDRG